MQIFQVDAFTRQPFTGNPASVVLGAQGRPDATLAAIAREFRHAEVAFVLPPEGPDHDLEVRFFNARKEAPFVGHATLAAHAVLLAQGLRRPGISRQKSGTGVLEVRAGDGDGGLQVEFRQEAPAFEPPLTAAQAGRVARALGLSPGELHPRLPALVARKGSTRLLLPVSGPGVLNALAPDVAALLGLGAELGAEGFFVFAPAGDAAGVRTVSRMFCPAIGIDEDPVSGNAHAMLARLLWDAGELDAADPAFIGHQGAQLHRPGEVQVRLEIEAGAMRAARIGGAAVIVGAGRLTNI